MPTKNYAQRLNQLRDRKTDPELRKSILTESFRSDGSMPETIKYVFDAMEPISSDYTQKTYDEADRVKNQISQRLPIGVSVGYDTQGSVPLNTHIKLHSDMDILTIHGNFETLQSPQPVPYPYQGNPLEDLKQLRSNIYQTLRSAFPTALVDNRKGKAVSISGGSLKRKFDILSCNWFNSNDYARTFQKKDRGIYLYDSDADQRLLDFPFLHMWSVNEKANRTGYDNYKRIIRLCKNLKMDADQTIDLSSFMITSVLYHIPDSLLQVSKNNTPRILTVASQFLGKVLSDGTFRQSLVSPNRTEYLFKEQDAKKTGELKKLKKELDDTILDLAEELRTDRRFIPDYFPYSLGIEEVLEKANIQYQF